MASVFLSHSSADKTFVRELAKDLKCDGHKVWFDEESIQVGQSIPQKIAEGLADSDVVIVVLSSSAVASGWVEQEWSSVIDDDIKTGGSIILPLLLDNCEIPMMLRSKKYADFRESHRVGFAETCRALDSFARIAPPKQVVSSQPPAGVRSKIGEVVSRIGDSTQSLASVLVDVVNIARQLGDKELEKFAKVQLGGTSCIEWDKDDMPEWIRCRTVKAWICKKGELNPRFLGWGGSASTMLGFIKRSDDFVWVQFVIPDSIQWIEDRASEYDSEVLLTTRVPVGRAVGKPENDDVMVHAYMEPDAFVRIRSLVRSTAMRLLSRHI